MAENSRSNSNSSNRSTKTIGYYINKFFRHSKRPMPSSTSMFSEASIITIQGPGSLPSIETAVPSIETDELTAVTSFQTITTIPDVSPTNESIQIERSISSIDYFSDSNPKDDSNERMEQIDDRMPFLVLPIDKRYKGQQFTAEQLPKFCEKLQNLVELTRTIQGESGILADYPRQLQADLDVDVKELDIVYAEIIGIQKTIDKVKRQRDVLRNSDTEPLDRFINPEDEDGLHKSKSFSISNIRRNRRQETFQRLSNEVQRNLEALKKLEILIQNRKTKAAYFSKRGRLDSSPSEPENTIATVLPRSRIPILTANILNSLENVHLDSS